MASADRAAGDRAAGDGAAGDGADERPLPRRTRRGRPEQGGELSAVRYRPGLLGTDEAEDGV